MNRCKCGCGQEIAEDRTWKKGHNKPHLGRTGKSNPFYGRIHSESARKKMSESLSGKECSKETREKLRRSSLGHPPYEGAGKTKWYSYTRLQDDVTIRVCGSHELETCRHLDLVEEPDWLYTGTRRIGEHRLLLSDGRSWSPDFWIPRLELYIDVKGYWRDGDRARLALEEYPDRVRVLLGGTYLDQLKELLQSCGSN